MIDGSSLSIIFENQELSKLIEFIFSEVKVVIVFRSSPNDKAQVIKFVQKDQDAYALAVGDGGNDVNMI